MRHGFDAAAHEAPLNRPPLRMEDAKNSTHPRRGRCWYMKAGVAVKAKAQLLACSRRRFGLADDLGFNVTCNLANEPKILRAAQRPNDLVISQTRDLL